MEAIYSGPDIKDINGNFFHIFIHTFPVTQFTWILLDGSPAFTERKKKCYTQSSKRLDSASQLLFHSAAGDSIYPSANGPEVRGGTLSRLHCALLSDLISWSLG